MDDDEFQVEVLKPMRHNRWAVIVPALGAVSEIARSVSDMFQAYMVYGAQHSMQIEYDRQYKEIINGRDSR